MKFRSVTLLLPTLAKGTNGASSGNNASSSELLDQVIDAVGGVGTLDQIEGLTVQSSLFRSRTLSQSYSLSDSVDVLVGRAANQSISFQFASGGLKQRVDRELFYDDYWRFAHTSNKLEFTLVVQTGPNASACFNKGGNVDDPSVPFGYADSYLTDYLVHSAQQTALFDVLARFNTSRSLLQYSITHNNASLVDYPTLRHPELNLELLVNNGTWLPYAVRSTENHWIYALSTSDIVFSNYAPVNFGQSRTIQYPRRVQTVYNDLYIVEDVVNENITVNPQYEDNFFTAAPPEVPAGVSGDPYSPHPPHTDNEYSRSEVHEFYESGLWFGPFGQFYNTSSVKMAPVFPGGSVPQIMNFFIGSEDDPSYVQLLVEFDDGFVITESPPHRTRIILQWIQENKPGKKITHVFPSHHHRDHTGGLGDLLAAGAKLVVPEIAKDYYSKVNDGNFEIETYSVDKPFLKKDGNVQFMSVWPDERTHASDWVFAIAGPVCGAGYNRSEVVIFNADVVNPSPEPKISWDTAEARPFFTSAVRQGVPIEATLIGAHGHTPHGLGTQDSLANLANIAGFSYPKDLSGTGSWCQT